MAYSNTGNDYDKYGFDCKFVTEPPPKFICSICVMILRDPYQTQCCGTHYCQCCVQQLVNKKTPCVTCGGVVRAFRDVSVTQKINSLQVKCTNVDWGCGWTGELGLLGEHVVTCEFKPAKCNSCGLFVPKSISRDHQSLHCPQRVYTCPHCSNFTSTYDEVRIAHWPKCPRFPIECPNGCSTIKKFEREKIMTHLKNDCNIKQKIVDMKETIEMLEVALEEKDQRLQELEAEVQESASKKDGEKNSAADKSQKRSTTKIIFRRKNSKPFDDIGKEAAEELSQQRTPRTPEDQHPVIGSSGKERHFEQEVKVLKDCIAEKVKIIEDLKLRNAEQCTCMAQMEDDFATQLKELKKICKKLSDEKDELEKSISKQNSNNSDDKFSQLI